MQRGRRSYAIQAKSSKRPSPYARFQHLLMTLIASSKAVHDVRAARPAPRAERLAEQMVLLPRPQQLATLSPRDLRLPKVPDAPGRGESLPAEALDAISPRFKPKRLRVPAHIVAAQRQLWMSDVRHWCEQQGHHIQGWGWDQKEEEEFAEWFSALDIDRSGSIEENEIRALMQAVGLTLVPGQMKAMFATVGKQPHESLSEREFVRFMMANMSVLAGSTFASTTGQLFDANTRLLMFAYRRSRLLEDLKDPIKRRNFRDFESFNLAYGPTLGIPALPTAPPAGAKSGSRSSRRSARGTTPRGAAPAPVTAEVGNGDAPPPLRSPRLPRVLPSMHPPSTNLAPPPKHLVCPPPGHVSDTPRSMRGITGHSSVPVWSDHPA